MNYLRLTTLKFFFSFLKSNFLLYKQTLIYRNRFNGKKIFKLLTFTFFLKIVFYMNDLNNLNQSNPNIL